MNCWSLIAEKHIPERKHLSPGESRRVQFLWLNLDCQHGVKDFWNPKVYIQKCAIIIYSQTFRKHCLGNVLSESEAKFRLLILVSTRHLSEVRNTFMRRTKGLVLMRAIFQPPFAPAALVICLSQRQREKEILLNYKQPALDVSDQFALNTWLERQESSHFSVSVQVLHLMLCFKHQSAWGSNSLKLTAVDHTAGKSSLGFTMYTQGHLSRLKTICVNVFNE